MTDTDSAQLKRVFTQLADQAGTFEPPPFETILRRDASRRGYRTGVLAGLAAIVVAALAVVLTLNQNHHRYSASPPPVGHSSATSSPTASQRPDDYPVVAGHVALYLEISRSTAPADGTPVVAAVHLVNGLGHSFVIPDACDGWLAVGLTVDGRPFDLANGGVACAGETISTGSTVIPVQISTTYSGCSQVRSQATAATPYCQGPAHNQMPNLPAGRYTIEIATTGVPAPIAPQRLDFTLTPR